MIETLILKALRDDPVLGGLLADFAEKPAVFYQQAPADVAEGWAAVQYPRLDYAVDWTYNPERKTQGSAAINVWCLNNGQTAAPEDIGEIVRELLRDLFLTDEAGETYALEWQRTDSFEAGGQNEPLTIGVTLSFDVLAFPVQATTTPDPIEGLSEWLKVNAPQSMVIGIDPMPELFRPTGETPVLYARLAADGSSMKNSYSVAWMDVTIPVHIFAPDTTARQTLCRRLTNAIAIQGECTLRDGSQMLFQRVAITASANPLHMGQISVFGRYGVLRAEEPGQLIQHVFNTRLEAQS